MSATFAPFIALAALALASTASAEGVSAPATIGESQAAPPAPVAGLLAHKIDESELGTLSGGQEMYIATSDQNLVAVNAGNSVTADSVVNGAVTLGSNAFNGFAGIGNFVINTGNNNNLQGNLSVNIVMAPAN